MRQFHMQRLTILLMLACLMWSMGYFLLFTSPKLVAVYDMYMMATVLFSSSVVFDPASLSFSAVVMYIAGCVFLFSCYYMATDVFQYRFTWILLTFVGSMQLLVLSNSLLLLLLGWDGLGISSFALIMYYQSVESRSASFLTLMINRLGDTLIMSSMVVFSLCGATLLNYFPPMEASLILLIYLVAALTKSAQYPFSSWLPAAMAAPTPVSALVHSSTLVTAGVYLLVRICLNYNMSQELCCLLLFFGSVTSFIGGICATYEFDLKKLIALSTLSQLGVMMFSLGLGLHNLALLHLFTHAMFKALLFLVAGCILLLAAGVQDLRLLGNITWRNPLLLVFLNVSTLSLMGFPFLSAYYSKHAILSAMWCSGSNMMSVLLMLVSTGLSSFYMLRLLKILNWGTSCTRVMFLPQLSMTFYLPLVLLFTGSCFIGMFFITLDVGFSSAIFAPSQYDFFLYMLMLMGILGGVTAWKSEGSLLCSSMFYLVPASTSLHYFSYMVLFNLKNLDAGWLEPRTYMVIPTQYGQKFAMWNLWASKKYNIAPYFILLGGGILCLMCLS